MSDHSDDRWPSSSEPGRWPSSRGDHDTRAGSLTGHQAGGDATRRIDTPSTSPDAATTILPRYDAETELMPAIQDNDEDLIREPDLLTHQDAAFVDDSAEKPAKKMPLSDAAARKKKIWRRVRRTCYVAAAVGILGPVLAFAIAYFFVGVPDPQQLVAAQGQTVTVYYADGSEMGTISPSGGGNRNIVPIDQIPKIVQQATAAAEDETFWTNNGFDIKGIFRAVYLQLTGGSGGGSGITQQYIKTATGQNQHTLTRKFIELVQAVKMSQQQSKDQIMQAYLNTVYYGRGAYGIQAAAKAYFNKDVGQLNASEAAFLAGCINVPALNEDVEHTTTRWNYTMGRMVANGWLSQSDRDKYATPPKPVPNSDNQDGSFPGPLQFVKEQVLQEAQNNNLSQDFLQRQGAKVYTTIDKNAQNQAVAAVHKVMDKDTNYPDLGSALVSINPATGEILAWYGGDDETKFGYDTADLAQQPGSSIKPLVFMAGMENNPDIGINAIYNGTDNQKIGDQTVNNSDKESCGPQCPVKTAMTESVNTVFYKMGYDIGPANVRKAALQAGIADKERDPQTGKMVPSLIESDANGNQLNVQAGISIGRYAVRPRDMAQAYATLANNGTYIPAHFISKVESSSGNSLYEAANDPAMQGKAAFDTSDADRNAKLARNVTESMLDVAGHTCNAPGGRVCMTLDGGRQVAAKTGTAQYQNTNHNSEAWMVGYTPQVVTAVWVGNRSQPGAIYGNYYNGYGPAKGYDIYGRGEPSFIWQAYMNSYLAGKPKVNFPPFVDLGGHGNFSGQPIVSSSSTPPNGQQDTGGGLLPITTTEPTVTTEPTDTTTPTTTPCYSLTGCPPETTTTTKTRPRN